MTTIPGEVQQEALENHRSDTLKWIILPAAAGFVLLVLLLVLLGAISTRGQVSIVADVMLSVLVLCPLAICSLPIMWGLVIAAVGMNRVYDWTQLRLDTLIRVSVDLSAKINRLMDNLARSAISFGVRAAPLEKMVFSKFDKPQRRVLIEGKHESDPTKRS